MVCENCGHVTDISHLFRCNNGSVATTRRGFYTMAKPNLEELFEMTRCSNEQPLSSKRWIRYSWPVMSFFSLESLDVSARPLSQVIRGQSHLVKILLNYLDSGARNDGFNLGIDIEIDLIHANPGCAGQNFHQDDPTHEACPTRFHICIPTSPLDSDNSIEYALPNSTETAKLELGLGEKSVHSGSVRHRGLPNAKESGRTNVFVAVQPSNLDVTFVLVWESPNGLWRWFGRRILGLLKHF